MLRVDDNLRKENRGQKMIRENVWKQLVGTGIWITVF